MSESKNVNFAEEAMSVLQDLRTDESSTVHVFDKAVVRIKAIASGIDNPTCETDLDLFGILSADHARSALQAPSVHCVPMPAETIAFADVVLRQAYLMESATSYAEASGVRSIAVNAHALAHLYEYSAGIRAGVDRVAKRLTSPTANGLPVLLLDGHIARVDSDYRIVNRDFLFRVALHLKFQMQTEASSPSTSESEMPSRFSFRFLRRSRG